MNILQIDSSPLAHASVSRQLAAFAVRNLVGAFPGADVTYRDVVADPPVHADRDIVDVLRFQIASDLSDRQIRERDLADVIISEVKNASVVVIGAPMYNYTVPSQLKAWVDRICQAGKTFRYAPEGPIGLVGSGKRALIIASRGGLYRGPGKSHLDFQVPYLHAIMNFIGIGEVSIVIAEGLNLGPDKRQSAIDRAQVEIKQIVRTMNAQMYTI